MAKQIWKPGNMIYPLPAVMVSVTDGEGNDNIIPLRGQERSVRIRRWLIFQSDHPVILMEC